MYVCVGNDWSDALPELVPMESLWKDGRRVRDVAVERSVRDPLTSGDGIGAVGVLSLIGPFVVERFAVALEYIVVSKTAERSMIKVNPIHVLSQPWMLDRAEESISKREVSPAPFIEVRAKIVMSGWPDLFLVNNGMHRSYAARRFGDKLIDAEIAAVWICDISKFYLNGTQLMRCSSDTDVIDSEEVPGDVATILECLGCGRKNDPSSFAF